MTSGRVSFAKLAFPAGIAAPLAAVMAFSVVSTAAADPNQAAASTSVETAASTSVETVAKAARSDRGTSRDSLRLGLPQAANKPAGEAYRPQGPDALTATALKAVGTRYSTANLKVRQVPTPDAKTRATLAVGEEITITSAKVGAYQQVIHKGKAAWVTAKYLTATKPVTKPLTTGTTTGSSSSSSPSSSSSSASTSSASGQITQAACAAGSRVESGLRSNTIKLYRSVCASFPQITSYGGVRPDSMPYHPSGRALDIMLPSMSQNGLGWQIARWVVANASAFNVDHVIFDQQIWVSGMGWRGMEDRGSATANHRDHVHVTVD